MSNKRIRLSPNERKALIVTSAIKMAEENGLFSFSIANVSRDMSNCSKATIKHYFTISELRHEVILAALNRNHVKIIAQAITGDHPTVQHFTPEQKQEILQHV